MDVRLMCMHMHYVTANLVPFDHIIRLADSDWNITIISYYILYNNADTKVDNNAFITNGSILIYRIHIMWLRRHPVLYCINVYRYRQYSSSAIVYSIRRFPILAVSSLAVTLNPSLTRFFTLSSSEFS